MSKKSYLVLIFKLLAIVAMQQQQIILYKRQHPRPKLRFTDRLFWVACSRLFKRLWRQTLAIVEPETVIRRHRDLVRLRWRWISRAKGKKPTIPQQTLELVGHMATENKTWGAERIRGELLKLGIRLSKRTIQKIIRPLRKHPNKVRSQNWQTFLANHSPEIWPADFFTVTTFGFKQLYVLVIFAIHTREIIHWNVTRIWASDQKNSGWLAASRLR